MFASMALDCALHSLAATIEIINAPATARICVLIDISFSFDPPPALFGHLGPGVSYGATFARSLKALNAPGMNCR
jgi:hypothetical protein